ncbi:putative flavoprotein involved in K+ transport [Actinomycetospora succinea]|uniref:Putative flavoprotein involved in K+ transport n=1 Tax=Actinomycetospora succinea TaxID=663603 RepID=A0A4R6V516_9PSEU|nr:NAD(P)/FAD-dependent oxidoreductase [Actinomycetospora succinea]TDQ54011.1 putative flavoprotein involved in K+ transport [Actinomycetospora succinea]
MHATTVIIGAGHAGLAMSRQLTDRSIDHVVLERGEVANSWRTERWDSLRLLTPTWHLGLPGDDGPAGADPAGFLTVPELVSYLDGYAATVAAPVHTGTTVLRVAPHDGGYEVTTDRGTWTCASVVLASGANNVAALPAAAEGVPDDVVSISTARYRSPDDVPEGGVLVVGASASGVQLADELARSGRRVTIATGEHVRMPRTYRGRDAFWWMERAGVLDERYDEVDDIIRARHTPSPQLVGSPSHSDIDLGTLQARGVEVVGKVGRLRDGVAQFSGGLANTVRLADLKLNRLLDRYDTWAQEAGYDDLGDPHRPEPTSVGTSPRIEIDLARDGIRTVLWATGYRPDHSWLALPVLDYKGRLQHDGGVVAGAPGVYVLGSSLLRRRRSTYIGGADQDTAELAAHLADHLAGRSTPPRSAAPEPVSPR